MVCSPSAFTHGLLQCPTAALRLLWVQEPRTTTTYCNLPFIIWLLALLFSTFGGVPGLRQRETC